MRRAVPLLLLGLLLCACNLTYQRPTLAPLTIEPFPAVTPAAGTWYEVFFTVPTCPPQAERVGGVDAIIADDLLRAQRSVDVAAFDLDALPIVDALIALEQRGIPVRVVTDDENEDLSSINRLRRNGTSVITDNRSGLMHNKFIVIDERIVWTGSLNFTSNGAYCNNNNAVRFELPELARNYIAEMDEMYVERLFGVRSPDNTPSKLLRVNGVLIESYFASEEKVATLLAQALQQADQEIRFMAFAFTLDEIGEAMLARAEAGVQVQGIFETTGSETIFSYFPVMREAGLPNLSVRQDGNPRIMHHKVIIIDRETVVFGSFNFSGNANDSNDENVLIVHDQEFAAFFLEEFELLWSQARR